MWEDWVDDDRINGYVEPVFSQEEQSALANIHRTWNNVADNTPQNLPAIEELLKNKYWKTLITCADETLHVFLKRGKFSEDAEIT